MTRTDMSISVLAEPGQNVVAGSGFADQCRVTVYGPHGRADLAVPATATIGLLVPVLARHVTRQTEEGRSWVLQRLGEPPLSFDATPELADLRDGDVLYLRPAEDPLPELTYDDLADGVAESIAARADRWQSRSTRRVLLGLAAVAALASGAAVALAGVSIGPPSLYSGLIALVLSGVAVAVQRFVADTTLSVVAGAAACGFAGLAGVLLPQDPADIGPVTPSGVLFAGLAAGLVAAALGLTSPRATAVYATIGALSAAAVAGSALVLGTALDMTGAATVVTLVLFLLGAFGPRLAIRYARLRAPNLPRTAEELQQSVDPESASALAGRVAVADGHLTAMILASSIAAVIDAVLLVRTPGWVGVVLPLLIGAAALLRARSLRSVWQRGGTIWAGAFVVAIVLVSSVASASMFGRVAALVILLAACLLLLFSASRLPTARLRPIWGQLADIAELWSALALLPLLLVLTGTYTYFQALGG
jgi:type VII secretion integral membrane protein EccD